MTDIRVATFDGPGAPPVIRKVPRPAGAGQGRADPDRRLRRVRHRPAHPQRPLAEAVAVAVHARPRAGRRDRRDRPGADPGLDRPAARGRRQGDAAAAHAVRHLLLVHALPRDRQQVPDAGLLRPLSRLRQAAASVGRLRRDGLCRPRHAARHQDLQAAGRHAAAPCSALGAADLLHPRLLPRAADRRLQGRRHGGGAGQRPDRRARGRRRAGDGGRPRDRGRRAGAAAARSVPERSAPRPRSASTTTRARPRASTPCARSSAATAPIS